LTKFELLESPCASTKMSSLPVRYKHDTCLEVGIDEAGRGCLWGPLYAAAVIWPPEEEWLDEHKEIAPQIKDSKKLSPKKRASLAQAIQALAIEYGIGVVTPQEIDSYGMTIANKLAFQRAIDSLQITPDRLLIDGILPIDTAELQKRKIQEQVTVVEGDALYLPIAAASILAKEARDDYVQEYVEIEPDLETKYSIGSSKGYGTEKHRKGILAHGKHEQHRNLFLRKLLGDTSDCLITDS
jgi:ribonuclease HII